LSFEPDGASQTCIAEKRLLKLRWTRKNIVDEIRRLHADEVELNYSSAEANHLYLVRAASWHYGTWRRAVEAAGLEYDSLSKYQRWDRKRIVARIRELHSEGYDLSWRAVSQEVDPPLAAAALRSNGFQSWRDAIAAAGLNIDEVARYKYWTQERVLREIKAYNKKGQHLSSKAMQETDQALFCAARRRFGSWDEALVAAGFDVTKIRLRQPSEKKTKSKPRAQPTTKSTAKRGGATRTAPAKTGSRQSTLPAPKLAAKLPSTTPRSGTKPLKKHTGDVRTGKRLATAGTGRAR
jgi:hypothetical protein